MNMRKLSINKACVLLGTLLLLAVGAVCTTVYLLTQNIIAVRCVFLFSLFVLLCVIFFVALIRRKLVQFSDAFCGQMDDMLSENMQPKQTACEESLFYKINYRLGRLYEVMQENKNSIAKERTDLQELISDISHQVKTPIANLKMINNTLLENEVPPQKQKEFLTAQTSQLDKLDFLMQAMIKMCIRDRTNTACGLLFAAVFVLLVVLMSDKITPYIYQLAEYFQVPFADYDVLFIYAFSILTTISCTTYVSISIEGKQIEILKSLPIAAKCLFRVKLLHHLSISVPTIFVLNTIMALYLQWPFPKVMLGYAFPLLCSVLIGMIGYILNLVFPNFEWENVTHIIKQSLPAILTALIGVVVTCGTAYLLLRFFPNALFMGSWIACAANLLFILVMAIWINNEGKHLYQGF